jgi:hypothetical protein
MLLKRRQVLLLCAFMLGGCGARVSSSPIDETAPVQAAVPSHFEVQASGRLEIQILAAGAERAVQFTQSKAAKTINDVAMYTISVTAEGAGAALFTATVNKKNAGQASDTYTIENVPAGKVTVTVIALDSANANITKGGSAAATATVVDQNTANAAISLGLLDGVAANGDISATVTVSNGSLVAPAVAVR